MQPRMLSCVHMMRLLARTMCSCVPARLFSSLTAALVGAMQATPLRLAAAWAHLLM